MAAVSSSLRARWGCMRRGGGDLVHAGGCRRRTVFDWLVDVACSSFALLDGFYGPLENGLAGSHAVLVTDTVMGAAASASVWLRNRWPVGLAVVLVAASTVEPRVDGALLVALFNVAVLRRPSLVAAIGVPALCASAVVAAVRPDPQAGSVTMTVTDVLLRSVVLAWGMLLRSRQELVLSLRERAVRAEAEAKLRAERARRLAREEIAREMHDVLAHRLSLLSLHAGALEFRPGAPAKEVGQAAAVIRESAHEALQDLREVIGVLRAPEGGDVESGRPQPSLATVPQLVEESRRTGMNVLLVDEVVLATADVAAGVGRTAYRIVQEGLTNARKHAPEAQTVITVSGQRGEGLTVEVRNTLAAQGRPSGVPGSGAGLIGLTERAALAHGRLEHGPTPSGEFRVHAWLPWALADQA